MSDENSEIVMKLREAAGDEFSLLTKPPRYTKMYGVLIEAANTIERLEEENKKLFDMLTSPKRIRQKMFLCALFLTLAIIMAWMTFL